MDYIEKCKNLIDCGAKIIDVNSTYIDEEVVIGEGTIIYPNTSIRGNSKIGKNNIIDMNTIIIDSNIGDNNKIKCSYLENCTIFNDNGIGPFAHIKDRSVINNHVIVGNFVEIKNSTISDKTNIKHLSYVGDAKVGNNVNIGAGVIFANYNPITKEKNTTIVEDNVSIGSNCVLISPIVLKKNALIGAGSTITTDVEEFSLALARCRQTNKNNYFKKEGNL